MVEDELGPKTVYTIKHSEIPKGTTQCVDHQWEALSECEVKCKKCPTAIIVNSEAVSELVSLQKQ